MMGSENVCEHISYWQQGSVQGQCGVTLQSLLWGVAECKCNFWARY